MSPDASALGSTENAGEAEYNAAVVAIQDDTWARVSLHIICPAPGSLGTHILFGGACGLATYDTFRRYVREQIDRRNQGGEVVHGPVEVRWTLLRGREGTGVAQGRLVIEIPVPSAPPAGDRRADVDAAWGSYRLALESRPDQVERLAEWRHLVRLAADHLVASLREMIKAGPP